MHNIGRNLGLVGVAVAMASTTTAQAAECRRSDYKAEQCVLRADGSPCVDKKDWKKDRCVLPSGEIPVEPLAFVGPALPESEAGRVALFYDVGEGGLPARTTRGAQCAFLLEQAAENAETGDNEVKFEPPPGVSVCTAAVTHAIGSKSPEWTQDSLDWRRYGLFYNTYQIGVGAGGPAWRVDVSVGGDRSSFQAWRPRGTYRRIREADHLALAAKLDTCCRATGCGDFVVLGSQQWEQYTCTYRGTSLDASANVVTYDVDNGIEVIDASERKQTWTLLDAVPVPDKDESLQTACAIVEELRVPADSEWQTTFFCPVFDLNPTLSGSGVRLVNKSLADGFWTIELSTSGSGEAELLFDGGAAMGGATTKILVGAEGAEGHLVSAEATLERLGSSALASRAKSGFGDRKSVVEAEADLTEQVLAALEPSRAPSAD